MSKIVTIIGRNGSGWYSCAHDWLRLTQLLDEIDVLADVDLIRFAEDIAHFDNGGRSMLICNAYIERPR